MKWHCIIFLFAVLPAAKSQSSQPGNKFIRFVPDTFFHSFSANISPVLTVHPGDTVQTETIDASGRDKNGIKRTYGGNPLTGPFYIEGSKPGDVLAITLINVSLNRSWAFTTEAFGSRSLPKDIQKQVAKGRIVKWKLDTQNGYAMPESASDHLQNFKVPLHPFLGCIGVAPFNRKNEVLSFFQGSYGGNLDFSGIAQSSTVYLSVFHDGAYFYIGDAHALQGDGELAGNALETSMNVEFTIKLIKSETLTLSIPRVEDSTYIMAVGTGKSLDNALKVATSGLLEWLQKDYNLSLAECTQVMSTSIEYTIAEIADPEVAVVAKIKKEILKGLKKAK
ncbi:MAG: acetamidase/formamidase family protein [Bacteroidota bacterium]